jgi:hypothetical protein
MNVFRNYNLGHPIGNRTDELEAKIYALKEEFPELYVETETFDENDMVCGFGINEKNN